ncbi:MAG: GC-type dockerin domain-anchored protein, partial [Phycisphaerales bacterium]
TQTIVPPEAAFGDGFGTSMSVDGTRLIVGSIYADYVLPDAGGVYVYEYSEGSWQEMDRLASPAPRFASEFGSSVLLQGDVALVEQDFGAYVFERVGGEWLSRDRLVAPDGPTGGRTFGNEMLLTEDWLFVGAPLEDSIASSVGAVYVFERTGKTSFAFTEKLTPPDPETNRCRLGASLAFDGQTLLAGAPNATGDFAGQGAVYAYELESDQWLLKQQFTHDDPLERNDFFGTSMSLANGLLMVGASGRSGAYVFQRDSDGLWFQTGRLPESGSLGGRAGASVVANGEHALVGAPDGASGGSITGVGYAYDFECLTCEVDLDLDGALTIFDFLTFLNLFQDGDPLADFDGDGELTIFDFLAFQTAFGAGCG